MNCRTLTILAMAGLAAACASTTDIDSVANADANPGARDTAVAVDENVDVVSADELLVANEETVEGNRVICREMLQAASNVIVRRCMRERDWRTYERVQEEWARQQLRRMQGSAFY